MEVEAFKAQREQERQRIIHLGKNVFYFGSGLGNALGNNLSLGAISRDHLHHPAFLYGQMAGDGLSVVWGAAEFVVGDGMMGAGGLVMVTSFGVLAPVATFSSTSGAAVASHGVVVMGKAMMEFSGKAEGQKSNSSIQDKKLSAFPKIKEGLWEMEEPKFTETLSSVLGPPCEPTQGDYLFVAFRGGFVTMAVIFRKFPR